MRAISAFSRGQNVLDFKSVQVSGPDQEQPIEKGQVSKVTHLGKTRHCASRVCCAVPCHAVRASVSTQAADSSSEAAQPDQRSTSGILLATP